VYRRGIALGLCVLATVTGCSAGGSEDHDDPPAPTINGENLTGAQVCEMVPSNVVRDLLEVRITGTNPWDRDKKPVTIAECQYEMADPDEGVGVGVSIWPGNVRAKDLVKMHFTGYAGERPAEYEEVDGLGDAAGFGPTNTLPNLYTLGVVTTYENTYRVIDVNVTRSKPPTLAQVRPIAERVLEKLDG
jgi:hypothetical protein